MDRPEVTLIVTTYQMPYHLERVLASAARQTVAQRMELVVSDDGSTDETAQVVAEFARRAPFPVRYCTLPHDGFRLSRTRNEGVRRANGERLVFLDGDCLIEPDHVEQHLRLGGPGVATNTYCVRLDEDSSQRISVAGAESGEYLASVPKSQLRALAWIQWKAWFYRWIGHSSKPALRGGNVGITKADYLRINGYDENFCGWGAEDDDAGRRMRRAGIQVRYILHRTRTYHLWHPPAATKPARYRDLGNLAYLKRPLRLTRCAAGVVMRASKDLTVRLAGNPNDSPGCERWLRATGWRREENRALWCDLELLALPGTGNFSRRADVRIAFLADASQATDRRLNQADVVISPQGDLGGKDQLRLRADELQPLYAALGWNESPANARHAA